jgi:hypothetical protein
MDLDEELDYLTRQAVAVFGEPAVVAAMQRAMYQTPAAGPEDDLALAEILGIDRFEDVVVISRTTWHAAVKKELRALLTIH